LHAYFRDFGERPFSLNPKESAPYHMNCRTKRCIQQTQYVPSAYNICIHIPSLQYSNIWVIHTILFSECLKERFCGGIPQYTDKDRWKGGNIRKQLLHILAKRNKGGTTKEILIWWQCKS
jgi:hypothetical protein